MSPASSGQSVEGAFSNVATPIISQSSPVFVHQMVFCDVNGCYSNFTSTSVGLFTNPSSLFFFCLCCFFTLVYTCPLFCINCSVQLNTLTIIWSPYTHTIYLFSVCCSRAIFMLTVVHGGHFLTVTISDGWSTSQSSQVCDRTKNTRHSALWCTGAPGSKYT